MAGLRRWPMPLARVAYDSDPGLEWHVTGRVFNDSLSQGLTEYWTEGCERASQSR